MTMAGNRVPQDAIFVRPFAENEWSTGIFRRTTAKIASDFP